MLPAADPNDKNQLFFARAPPSATEADVRETFSPFGEVGPPARPHKLLACPTSWHAYYFRQLPAHPCMACMRLLTRN